MPDFSQIELFTKAVSIRKIALGGAILTGDRMTQAELARMSNELIALVGEKTISSMLAEVIALEEIPGALVKLAQKHVRGKMVMRL